MKCRILLEGSWQIRAICKASKPFSLVEEFLNNYCSNYRKNAIRLRFLFEEVSNNGPERLLQDETKAIVGATDLYEFRVGRLRVFFTKATERHVIVLLNAYVKDDTKRDKEIKKAKKLQEKYIDALQDKTLEIEIKGGTI